MAYILEVDGFRGPLDELLAKARKKLIDIFSLSLAAMVKEFLDQLDLETGDGLETAIDFLVPAASLIYLKSRFLIPREGEEGDEEEEAELDPMLAFIEYQRIKEAVDGLYQRELLDRDVFCRPISDGNGQPEQVFDLEDVNMFHLAKVFFHLLEDLGPEPVLELEAESLKVSDRIEQITALLASKPGLNFHQLLPHQYTRRHLIVTFLALLELVRQRLILLLQPDPWGEIMVFPVVQIPEEVA
jgi:segregation and condensation protein A